MGERATSEAEEKDTYSIEAVVHWTFRETTKNHAERIIELRLREITLAGLSFDDAVVRASKTLPGSYKEQGQRADYIERHLG